MAIISTTTLANGGKVEISVGEIPRNGTYDLVARLLDNKGAVVRTITVDTASNSDGTTAPPRGESFSNVTVVSLSHGGFAIAYDDTSINPPGGASNKSEVHLYNAAGADLGAFQIGTSGGGQPSPMPGEPQIIATTSGGVVLVTRTFDFHTTVTALDEHGVAEASRIYDVRPQGIYVAGLDDKIVVTLATSREVLNHDLTLISNSPLTDIGGTAGDDTLQGGAGYDILTGGAGHDKFVFAVDGSVDQVTDFDAANDKLALVDASGAPLNSATGVLTFWRATGLLTYDPDGDQGPAAAQAIAVLPGLKTLTQNSFAQGYEPALLRIYNPITAAQVGLEPGSRSDMTFGFGKQNYLSASADYSPTGTLLTYGVSFADGTSSMQWFDKPNAQPWTNLVAQL